MGSSSISFRPRVERLGHRDGAVSCSNPGAQTRASPPGPSGSPTNLAGRAIVRRPADEPGDLGLQDRLLTGPTGLILAAIHGILGQEAALQPEDRPIAGVEAGALE